MSITCNISVAHRQHHDTGAGDGYEGTCVVVKVKQLRLSSRKKGTVFLG